MLADNGLDSLGARHSSLLAHQRRDSTHAPSQSLPNRIQRGRADVVLRRNLGHNRKVVPLILPHLLNC